MNAHLGGEAMRSQFSCSVLAFLADLARNTPFCRQVLTERHRKGLLQTVQTTTISPESNRKERFCSGSFLRQGRACAWVINEGTNVDVAP